MIIGDGWILSLLPQADTTPPLVRHSMERLLRVIRTWPRILAKELQLPPMIHPSQVPHSTLPQPLAICFTICKMWAGQCDGASEIIQDTVRKEMKSLFDRVCKNSSPDYVGKHHGKQHSRILRARLNNSRRLQFLYPIFSILSTFCRVE
jgi:hypothetical protein